MKRIPFAKWYALCMLCILATACGNQTTQSKPTGNIADIKSVSVSKPSELEIDQLVTISKLPANACTTTDEGKVCSISRDQTIKWGWGFCDNDEATLHLNVSTAQVKLRVDDIQIPENLIYQRDGTYNRQQNAYCHTWLVKLSGWKSGNTVRLENIAKASDLGLQHNVYVINVK